MTSYSRYWQKVRQARGAGFSDELIIAELKRERASILPRCIMKQATLAQDRNHYKSREAARAAHECLNAIDQIIGELLAKEIPA